MSLFRNVLLRCCIAAVLGGAGFAAAQGQSLVAARTVNVRSYDSTGKTAGRWTGDGIAYSDAPSLAHFFDAEGQAITSIALTIPGASETHVMSVGHRSGEAFVFCGWAADRDKHIANFLALAYNDGRPTKIVRTDPYVPGTLRIAADGTIWTFGSEGPTYQDAGLIRHFDSSGNLIDSFLPLSSITKKDYTSGMTNFAVASGRVGWYPGKGKSYYEVANGKLQTYAPMPQPEGCDAGVVGLALLDNGAVFASLVCQKLSTTQLFSLDRTFGEWKSVDLPGDALTISGSYENNLVLHGRGIGKYLIFDGSQWSLR